MIGLYFPYQYQKQQTILRMFGRSSYLKGTSGASRIFCSVMADQLLANPPGHSRGKIVFKVKSQPIWYSVCRTRACASSERRRRSLSPGLPSLGSSVIFGG